MPLSPADYRKTQWTHRRGLAADRPAAADVLTGTLYYSTDTGVLERSNGASWETYSGSGTTIINNTTVIPPVYDGVDGEDALFGPQGIPGPVGATGSQGVQGSPGQPGVDGEDGQDSLVPGPPGPTGATGPTGPPGPAGPQGISGEDGEDGLDSFIPGPQGLQGLQGVPGSPGQPGLDGEDGLDSLVPGPLGPPGPQGLQGLPGQPGLDAEDPEVPLPIPGPQGATGPTGAQGPAGSMGLPGEDGEDGQDSFLPGPTGPQGLQGLQGIPGPAGIDAEDPEVPLPIPGPTGATGPTGSQGPAGSMGLPGEDGQDGLDSFLPGPTGATGPQGPTGPAGIPGPPGLDAEEPEVPYLIPGPKGETGAQGPAGTGGGGGVAFPLPLEPEEPELPYIIPGNKGADGATAGTGPVTTVEVNLGSTPTWRGTFTITDASITSGTRVLVWQAPGPYTGKGTLADEAELQPVRIIAVESFNGSCKVYWETPPIVVTKRLPQSMFLTSGTTVLGSPKDPQAVAGGENIRISKVAGNVKFSYMVCRNGGTSLLTFTTTGDILDLDFGNADLIVCNNASTTRFLSIKAGTNGQRVTFLSIGAGLVTFQHETASPSSQGKFSNFVKVTGSDTPINGGAATFQYDSTVTRWRMVDHVQGKPVTPTFAAGDFTGSGSMTWTVDSGDVRVDAYTIVGRAVHYQYYYDLTTVGGTPSTDLRRAVPSLLAPTEADATVQWSRNLDNGTANDGFAYVGSSFGNFIFIRKDKAAGNWAAATNNTTVQGFLVWEIG